MPIEVSNDPNAFRAFEQAGWTAAAMSYESVVGPLTAQSADATLDAAGVTAGCKVLDVCTGHGVLAHVATQRGAKVSALDFAETMIAAARRNVPTADCQLGDAQNLPYEDDTFDAVVCGFGLLHVPEPDRALVEIHRVLRPGGRVALSVWQRPSQTNGFGVLLSALKAYGRFEVALPHGPDVFQFGELKNMTEALKQGGFNEVDATTVIQTIDVETANGFVEAVLQGSVRMKSLLLAQDHAALTAINAAVAKGVEDLFSNQGSFRVLMPAIVGSGMKP